MSKITLKEFFESKKELGIHCDTEDKAKKLLQEFDKMGKRWSAGNSYLSGTYYGSYNNKTVYTNLGYITNTVDLSMFKIYEFEDVIFDKPKSKFNVGDKIKLKNIDKIYTISEVKQGFYRLKEFAMPTIWVDEFAIDCVEKIKLSEDEITVLKALDIIGYKYLARDKNENIFAYDEEPEKGLTIWSSDCFLSMSILKSELFNFVKWTDKNPYNVKELLGGCYD